MTALVIIAVVDRLLASPDSALNAWVVRQTQVPLHVWGVAVSLHWLRVLPPGCAVLVLIPCVGRGVLVVMAASRRLWDMSAGKLARLIAIYLGFLVLVALSCAVVCTALVRPGFASFQPVVPAGSDVSSAFAACVWHVIDGIQGLEIRKPSIGAPHDLHGVAAGVVVLAFKMTVVAILVLPIARITARYAG